MPRPREEGTGGRDGIVLNMTLSGDGIWNAVYSVQASVGSNQQALMLSVDTGSSDIWLASRSCSSSACSAAHSSMYDSSSAIQTGQSMNLSFLEGSVSGPIVWDSLKLGPYSIPSQALVAADQVTDEALSSNFVGLLGLALPPNSKIAKQIPPTESDQPDGATLQMNLFGLTPIDTAPEQRFFGLSLERPGSSRIPSLLGIGRHPSGLVPGFDPSKVTYAELVSSRIGDTFWRVPVMNITAWVDGAPKPIQLGESRAVPTSTHVVALVDSGGSSIVADVDIVNGIYGAWGIGPGEDGNYYVPCTTPINISLELANFPPIALHPLDMTSPPASSESTPSSSTSCRGLIEAASPGQLSGFADIILGVAFLRNTYTVLSSSSSDNALTTTPGSPNPRLGVIPLTDPTTALSEFHNVRVLGQPLEPPHSTQNDSATVGKKLSVGVTVLLCIVGFFVACALLFALRWWIVKRRLKRTEYMEPTRVDWVHKDGLSDEDTLRTKRWEEGKRQSHFYADSSIGSEFTRVERSGDHAGLKEGDVMNMHAKSSSASSASDIGHIHGASPDPNGWRQELGVMHVRTASEADHGGAVAAAVPLLDEGDLGPWSDTLPTHDRFPSLGSVSFADESGIAGIGVRNSIASSGSKYSPRHVPGARGASPGSISSTASRTWRAEVGQILQPVGDSNSSETSQGRT